MDSLPKKILLATDGSEEAAHAARASVELTQRIADSELHAVYVGPVARHAETMRPVAFDPKVERRVQERFDIEAQKLLDEQIGRIETEGGTVVQAHLRSGNQADCIVRLAEEVGANMIVLGSRGHGGVRRALLGSVSEEVIRHAHCPVLVVRNEGQKALLNSRIVLAVDGSRESEASAQIAASLAKAGGCELYLVHAAPDAHMPPEYPFLAENAELYVENAERQAREFLEHTARSLRSQVPVHSHLRLGRPAKEIVELADEVDAGMIVLGSRGLGGIRRALMGEVSDSVARHARCPVLVVRTEYEG